MAAKFEVYNDKVGKFRFRVKTGNGTRAAMRDSVCLTASMLIGNGHDDRGQYRQCCRRIERRGFDPAGAFENCLLRGHFLGPDQGAVSLAHPERPLAVWPAQHVGANTPGDAP